MAWFMGWEVSSIQEKLVFETDGSYDPHPEKYSEVINQWWVDGRICLLRQHAFLRR